MRGLISLTVIAVLFISSCTTTQKIQRPDGSTEYLIACGAASGFNICYKKANKLCPNGYETLSENSGLNRKEIRIECPNKEDAEQS